MFSDEVCFECGSAEKLHDHHVVPRSRGGTSTIPLCCGCHAKAHGKSGDFDISSLTSTALQHKKAKGEYTGGKVPYGYRLDDDGATLVEDEDEQEVITAVLEARDAGLSLRRTAALLSDEGFSTRAGGNFNHTAVSRIEKAHG